MSGNILWVKETVTHQKYEKLVSNLAKQIKNSDKQYTAICGIPRGGLVVAVWLSHLLDLPFDIPLYFPGIKNCTVLVVDDIADTGKTLSRLQPNIDTATLFYKKRSVIKPTYYAEETENWIVFPYERTEEIPNRAKDD